MAPLVPIFSARILRWSVAHVSSSQTQGVQRLAPLVPVPSDFLPVALLCGRLSPHRDLGSHIWHVPQLAYAYGTQ